MAKHLLSSERVKVECLLEAGIGVDQIAKNIGRHRSTIYRELKRLGVSEQQYNAELYHTQARKNMGRKLDTGPSPATITLVEQKILQEQWSPEQISNWLKLHNKETVSHSWIYSHIAKDKEAGGELFNHQRRGNYTKGHKEYKGHIPNRVSIEERPEIVNMRERLGDYEIDLIVGPKNKGAILTAVDRSSRECLLTKLDSKEAKEVCNKINKSFSSKSGSLITITSDNGTEFTNHEDVAQLLDIKYYFAHPYASYERGSIENLNGLVRQYIPKGTAFDDISDEHIDIIQNKLNNRPRKVLGFFTPNEYIQSYYNQNPISSLSLLKS